MSIITNIETGNYSYVPRYVSFGIEDNQTFGLVTLCQTEYSRETYLAQFVFKTTREIGEDR